MHVVSLLAPTLPTAILPTAILLTAILPTAILPTAILLTAILLTGAPLLAAQESDAFPLTLDMLPVAESGDLPPRGTEAWSDARRATQLAREDAHLAAVSTERLAAWHELLASEPHRAGTAGDRRVIEALARVFGEMGLEVEVHRFWAYLPRPIDAALTLVAPTEIELPLKELPLAEDPYSNHPGLTIGWNAFSGSGEVEGEVVYANYGTKEDFAWLAAQGVDCTGKIVVARYGGNYRGYKAKFAEAAGAAGLVIYTDPADSGFGRGLEWPVGGWANCSSIQRGSIKTLPYFGDPLTPDVPATKDAKRLDPESLALPRIPVQPVGWQAAAQILGPMTGDSVPDAWQGGLPFRYRVTGGDDVRVRLSVQQAREIVESANVVATLRGSDAPEGGIGPRVIVGCHHDAWAFGAADPTCGLIAVVEAAHVLAERARAGDLPRRSISFAAWGAEEAGIIGSVEWIEAHLDEVREEVVAYFNLDMAAVGTKLRSAASPSLRQLVAGAADRVPQPGPGVAVGTSALDAWLGDEAADPRALPGFGELGGGSDHVGFIALAGVPSVSLTASGAPGTSYHSVYDDLAWYRRVVGADYASAALVTSVVMIAADRIANAEVLPISVAAPPAATSAHLAALSERGRATGLFDSGGEGLAAAFEDVAEIAEEGARRGRQLELALARAGREDGLDAGARTRIERVLFEVDRTWMHYAGLPGRSWFRNLYAAPDETSGYASWPLPGLRKAVEDADAGLLRDQVRLLRDVLRRQAALQDALEAVLARVPTKR